LIKRWEKIVGCGGYILRGVNRHGHINDCLNPSSVSTILKNLQIIIGDELNVKPLSGHSFRVGAALDLIEQGLPIEKIMLRGGWKTETTTIKYLKTWI
jgi:hypothetical protein